MPFVPDDKLNQAHSMKLQAPTGAAPPTVQPQPTAGAPATATGVQQAATQAGAPAPQQAPQQPPAPPPLSSPHQQPFRLSGNPFAPQLAQQVPQVMPGAQPVGQQPKTAKSRTTPMSGGNQRRNKRRRERKRQGFKYAQEELRDVTGLPAYRGLPSVSLLAIDVSVNREETPSERDGVKMGAIQSPHEAAPGGSRLTVEVAEKGAELPPVGAALDGGVRTQPVRPRIYDTTHPLNQAAQVRYLASDPQRHDYNAARLRDIGLRRERRDAAAGFLPPPSSFGRKPLAPMPGGGSFTRGAIPRTGGEAQGINEYLPAETLRPQPPKPMGAGQVISGDNFTALPPAVAQKLANVLKMFGMERSGTGEGTKKPKIVGWMREGEDAFLDKSEMYYGSGKRKRHGGKAMFGKNGGVLDELTAKWNGPMTTPPPSMTPVRPDLDRMAKLIMMQHQAGKPITYNPTPGAAPIPGVTSFPNNPLSKRSGFGDMLSGLTPQQQGALMLGGVGAAATGASGVLGAVDAKPGQRMRGFGRGVAGGVGAIAGAGAGLLPALYMGMQGEKIHPLLGRVGFVGTGVGSAMLGRGLANKAFDYMSPEPEQDDELDFYENGELAPGYHPKYGSAQFNDRSVNCEKEANLGTVLRGAMSMGKGLLGRGVGAMGRGATAVGNKLQGAGAALAKPPMTPAQLAGPKGPFARPFAGSPPPVPTKPSPWAQTPHAMSVRGGQGGIPTQAFQPGGVTPKPVGITPPSVPSPVPPPPPAPIRTPGPPAGAAPRSPYVAGDPRSGLPAPSPQAAGSSVGGGLGRRAGMGLGMAGAGIGGAALGDTQAMASPLQDTAQLGGLGDPTHMTPMQDDMDSSATLEDTPELKLASLDPFTRAFAEKLIEKRLDAEQIKTAIKRASAVHPDVAAALEPLTKAANLGALAGMGLRFGGRMLGYGAKGLGAVAKPMANMAGRAAAGAGNLAMKPLRAAGGAVASRLPAMPPGVAAAGPMVASGAKSVWNSGVGQSLRGGMVGSGLGYGADTLAGMAGIDTHGMGAMLGGGMGAAARNPLLAAGMSKVPGLGKAVPAMRNLATAGAGGAPAAALGGAGMYGMGAQDGQEGTIQAMAEHVGMEPAQMLTLADMWQKKDYMGLLQHGWGQLDDQTKMLLIGGGLLGAGGLAAGAMGHGGLGAAGVLGGLGLAGYGAYQGGQRMGLFGGGQPTGQNQPQVESIPTEAPAEMQAPQPTPEMQANAPQWYDRNELALQQA